MPPSSRTRDLLRHPPYLFLTAANGVSQIGDRLGHMAIIGLIAVLRPGEYGAFGSMSVALALPVLLLSPFTGYLSDRFSRKGLLLTADLVRALLLVALAFVSHRQPSLTAVYVGVFFLVGWTLLFNVAKSAYLPDLVPSELLLPANAWNAVVVRLTTVVGAVVGGWLSDMLGPMQALTANALTYGVSFALLLRLPAIPPRRQTSPSMNRFSSHHLRLPHIRPGLLAFAGGGLMFWSSAVAFTLLIPVIQQQLGLKNTGVGVAGGLLAVGLGIGIVGLGMVSESWLPFLIRASSLVMGGMIALAGLVQQPAAWLVGSFLAGLAMSPLLVGVDTLLQRIYAREERGSAFALKEFLGAVAFVGGSVGMGWAADRYGLTPVLALAALPYLFPLLLPTPVIRDGEISDPAPAG
ncbi:MAG: MFS transporter [Candidatus Hydrothermae bacterium]|nr:MFS transporter [Candidatus Hydrothermae bacterium]